MPLNIIGAGMGRTGTHSLKLALDQLGVGPCHHMIELVQHPEQFALWERVFDEQPVDWEEVFAGYRSSCDAPSALVYRELSEHYPNAKVILTTRDPESWWRSASATIMSPERRAGGAAQDTQIGKMMAKALAYQARRGVTRDYPTDLATATAFLQRHNEEVRRVIAPGRLLVYDVKDGWGPLCRFLGLDVPSTPFPRTNTTEEFQARLGRLRPQGIA
jgi:hypothetical protein